MNFKDEMKQKVAQIEIILDEYLPAQEGLQKTVLTAMNTTVKAGGKRLRPMLINETYQMFGGKGDIVKPFMAAIEMIHTYSLIHDDLPALDNDDYRRGQKTCHIVYGEDMAILAGDALLNYAYEVATKAFDLAEKDQIMNVVEAIKILASKPGIYGMIGGQVADVELEGTPLSMEQILFIHKNKTSALIEACMMIGAVYLPFKNRSSDRGFHDDRSSSCRSIQRRCSEDGRMWRIYRTCVSDSRRYSGSYRR